MFCVLTKIYQFFPLPKGRGQIATILSPNKNMLISPGD